MTHIEEINTGLPLSAKKAINQVLRQHPTINTALLYGSRAMGTFREGSDIDLTLTGETSYNELQKIEQELDDSLLPYKIDLSLMKDIDNTELLEHIRRVGVEFYQRCPPSRSSYTD